MSLDNNFTVSRLSVNIWLGLLWRNFRIQEGSGSSVAFAATSHLLYDLCLLLTSQEDEAIEVTPWVPRGCGIEQRCYSQRNSSLTALGGATCHVTL